METNEIIKHISEKTGIAIDETNKILDEFIELIGEELGNGHSVKIIGLGTFEAGEIKARTFINTQTGEFIKVKRCFIPKFRAGKWLKEKVNEQI